MDKIIRPVKKIFGEVTVPGDKSISHRALMAGSIARGTTAVRGIADSDDCRHTMSAFKAMGIDIKTAGLVTTIEGRGLRGLSRPNQAINAGNSGTTMRILPGILAGQDFGVTLTGDDGLKRRPMRRVVEPLSKMGVDISARSGEFPPLNITGGIVRPLVYKMPVASAQVKSAILFAGLYASGTTKVIENVKSRDHTERMLKYFGADIFTFGNTVSVRGLKELSAKQLEVPGDISSASFFLVAATILKDSSVTVHNVSINPTRAGMLDILKRMGARLKVSNKKNEFEPSADVTAEYSKTRGITIRESEIPSIIDELPLIFLLAALSKGRTVIKGAEELRVKETDRINSMSRNLRAMGAAFDIRGNEIVIEGAQTLEGSRLESFQDHRTCMTMAVAAMAARGDSFLTGVECVSKSYPGFFDAINRLTIL